MSSNYYGTLGKAWHNDRYVGDHVFTNGHIVPIYEANSVHTLNMLVGYAKHVNRDHGDVYFRGQAELHGSLLPSLARNGSTLAVSGLLSSFIGTATMSAPILKTFGAHVREPLLQHYGMKTKWLDLVDNLWVALYFGLHKIDEKIIGRVYNNVKRRETRRPTELELTTPGLEKQFYQYVLLVLNEDPRTTKARPGYTPGLSSIAIDLRKAAPSIFLRPHAQHAILMRKKQITHSQSTDLSDQVVLIVRLLTSDVHDWLGFGQLGSSENMFPSAFNDPGYSILLESIPFNKTNVASIGSIAEFSFSASKVQ